MPLYNDYRDMMQRSKAEDARHIHEQRSAVMPRLTEITHKAQQVVDHPGWQWFLDTLESRSKELENHRLSHMHAMVNSAALGQELERLKIAMNRVDSELAGLKYAVSLVPQAVEFGIKITGEISQAAAGSIAGSRA